MGGQGANGIAVTDRLAPLTPSAPVEPWRRAGCHRDPSTLDPDPALFFATPEARDLQASLLVALRLGEGGLFIVTGPAGIGKTMLLRVFEDALREAGEVVRFHDCRRDGPEMQALLEEAAEDGPRARGILLIDGAQDCDDAALAGLHRLLLPGPGQAPTTRVVISGSPEIEPRLQQMADTALASQMPFARLRLEPIADALVGDFLMHRLWQSGFTGILPLSPEALQRVTRHAGGLPRRIIDLAAAELAIAWAGAEAVPAPVAAPPGPIMAASSRLAGPLAAMAAGLAIVAGLVAWLARPGGALPEQALATAPATPTRTAIPLEPPLPVASATAAPEQAAAPLAPPVRLAQAAPAARTEGPVVEAPGAGATPVEASPVEVPAVARPVVEAPAVTPPSIAAPSIAAPGIAAPGIEASIVEAPTNETLTAVPSAEAVPDLAAMLAMQDVIALPVDEANEGIMASLLAGALPAAGTTAAAKAPTPPVSDPTPVPVAPIAQAVPQATLPADPPPLAAPAPAPTVSAPAASVPDPVPAPSTAPVPPRLTAAQVLALRQRGDAYLETGDIAAARLLFERAAVAGDAAAMRSLARTYDPAALRQWGVVGLAAAPDRAAYWYRKAAETEQAARR